jgi:hypothetical protein
MAPTGVSRRDMVSSRICLEPFGRIRQSAGVSGVLRQCFAQYSDNAHDTIDDPQGSVIHHHAAIDGAGLDVLDASAADHRVCGHAVDVLDASAANRRV